MLFGKRTGGHVDVTSLNDWERTDFIAPEGAELPDWLAALVDRHRAACDAYQRSIG